MIVELNISAEDLKLTLVIFLTLLAVKYSKENNSNQIRLISHFRQCGG